MQTKVYQPIIINKKLAPEEEFVENRYSQAPLVAGYTWFHVHQAVDSSGANVEVYHPSGGQLYPPLQLNASSTTVTYIKQPAHGVRARTHEENYTLWGLLVAAGSLALIAAFQIIDWALRFFLKV